MSQDSQQPAMSVMEHLSELINRLKIVILALGITCSIAFLPSDAQGFYDPLHYYKPVVSFMMQRMRSDFLPPTATLIAGGLVDTLFVYMYLSLLVGVVLASPVIAYELYAYVSPGLYPNERKYVVQFVGSFVGLFVLGLVIAYFLIIPLTFRILVWFITSAGAVPFISIKDFYNWILTLLLASGIFYTIPVFVVLLVQFGIIPAKMLSGRTKILAYVALFMIIFIFGPDPTPLTATVVMIPFAAIFEIATFAARRIEKGRPQAATALVSPQTPSAPTCRYCGGRVASSLCSVCGKSQI